MKPAIANERPADDGDSNHALRLAFKWMQIRKGVSKFRSHEDADAWWKVHFLTAYRRAKAVGSTDISLLRHLLESQGITPPE